MAFSLPPLPYDYNALEPHIDEQTMRIHHDKHHATYVNNLNAALEPHPDLQKKSIEELLASLDALPEAIRTPVRNNGGGHANHTAFWEMMAPGGAKEPGGALAAAITKAFGGFDKFKEQFAKACTGRFGSGWAWLIADKGGGLTIDSTPNQDTPIMQRKAADPRLRRLGARVLPEVPEPAPRLRDRVVERGQLDRRRAAATTRR